jgi:hypothetical protein
MADCRLLLIIELSRCQQSTANSLSFSVLRLQEREAVSGPERTGRCWAGECPCPRRGVWQLGARLGRGRRVVPCPFHTVARVSLYGHRSPISDLVSPMLLQVTLPFTGVSLVDSSISSPLTLTLTLTLTPPLTLTWTSNGYGKAKLAHQHQLSNRHSIGDEQRT